MKKCVSWNLAHFPSASHDRGTIDGDRQDKVTVEEAGSCLVRNVGSLDLNHTLVVDVGVSLTVTWDTVESVGGRVSSKNKTSDVLRFLLGRPRLVEQTRELHHIADLQCRLGSRTHRTRKESQRWCDSRVSNRCQRQDELVICNG